MYHKQHTDVCGISKYLIGSLRESQGLSKLLKEYLFRLLCQAQCYYLKVISGFLIKQYYYKNFVAYKANIHTYNCYTLSLS